jgi:pimeloyl-ACP methyl ester carboxylesterase
LKRPNSIRRTLKAAALAVFALPLTLGAQQATSEEISLSTPTGSLAGTLTRSITAQPGALAIIIAGSGPTDRNGNVAGAVNANAYGMLADSLAAHGIASLRYDKRGVGGSRGAATLESALRFEMYADDAAGWVRRFRSDARFARVIIVGHSEGSLLGMLAAQRERVDAFVSIAGPARGADMVMHDQLAGQLPSPLDVESDSILAHLRRGDTVANTSPMLATLYRQSVQPYYISWFRYTGATELAKLAVPVLIVQGTSDIQVAVSEADLLAEAQPRARVAKIVGMNHVLKLTPAGKAEQLRYYADPTVPIAADLVLSVATFIHSLGARR